MNTPDDYDAFVKDCWMGGVQPLKDQIAITALGLAGESAEVMEKLTTGLSTMFGAGKHAERIKKVTRGDHPKAHHDIAVAHELGDILFYVSNQARLHGFTLTDIMNFNTVKLAGRIDRSTLRGSGDDR